MIAIIYTDTNIGEYRRDNELQPNSLPEAAISLIRSGHNEHNVRSALTRFYQTRGKSYPLIEFTYLRFYVICQTYISNLHYGICIESVKGTLRGHEKRGFTIEPYGKPNTYTIIF